MEHMRRRSCLSKPPLHPPHKYELSARARPLKMVTPLPLSEAFENSLHCLDPPKGAAGPRDQPVVDLNVLPMIKPPEGDGMKCSKKPVIDYKIIEKKLEELAWSSSDPHIPTLDEAIENEKSGRNMDPEEERKLRRCRVN